MRFGLVIPNRGPAAFNAVKYLPRRVEGLGFTSMWFTDHVIGVRSFEPVYQSEWLEALTSLAYVAGTTSTIRLGVGVLVAPYRDPVMAAKMLTTIDGLSDGRLDVGVGAGWTRSEFHALGAGERFERRGRVTDEALAIITRCWEGGEFGWDGEFSSFRRIVFEPTPKQRPHPPIWIGGNTGPALRRAARFADVWHPTNMAPNELVVKGRQLDELAGRRLPRAMRLRVQPSSDPAELRDTIDAYDEVACDQLVLEVDSADPEVVERFAIGFAGAVDLDA